jgi:hypothetical protein
MNSDRGAQRTAPLAGARGSGFRWAEQEDRIPRHHTRPSSMPCINEENRLLVNDNVAEEGDLSHRRCRTCTGQHRTSSAALGVRLSLVRINNIVICNGAKW